MLHILMLSKLVDLIVVDCWTNKTLWWRSPLYLRCCAELIHLCMAPPWHHVVRVNWGQCKLPFAPQHGFSIVSPASGSTLKSGYSWTSSIECRIYKNFLGIFHRAKMMRIIYRCSSMINSWTGTLRIGSKSGSSRRGPTIPYSCITCKYQQNNRMQYIFFAVP